MINDIMTQCESVICCRVSPKEKADVVRLVKDNLGKITLGIGDGANDVNMIQEAHIGVGIYGKEGMRAVQASDYALPEFKALWKLLMVHGRWSYIRISEMIMYFFYKNMIFTLPQIINSFYCAYSGNSVYDDWYITGYNLAFTSIPLIVRGVFDQDLYYKRFIVNDQGKEIEYKTNLREYFPFLYYVGQKNQIFTLYNLFLWIFNGAVFGLAIFVMIMTITDQEQFNVNGEIVDTWMVSITLYTTIVLVSELSNIAGGGPEASSLHENMDCAALDWVIGILHLLVPRVPSALEQRGDVQNLPHCRSVPEELGLLLYHHIFLRVCLHLGHLFHDPQQGNIHPSEHSVRIDLKKG